MVNYDISDLLGSQLGYQQTSTVGGWYIASIILAVIGALLVVFLFITKQNKDKFKGFTKWLYDFLNFDFLTLELIVKALYAGATIFVILNSINYIAIDFLEFLKYLLMGIVLTRLVFELLIMLIKIWRNTTDINNKMK